MATPRVTIEVTNILQGGVTCQSPTIEAHLVNGLVMPCPVVGGKIELQLDGLESGYCFDLIIDCDDCNACPPIQKRVCLCDTNDDCSACENCIDGICVSDCAADEFCNNGQCKECLADGDCGCNKECLEGTCACPPELPYEHNGCCYECNEGDTNDSCQVCLGGQWAAKDCGENWLLNPDTCACEQCLDSGDCDAPNTCCVNGKCSCCPGYYFDPSSGGCLPIPDCNNGNDCPPCFDCVNGTCAEISCPEGYVRTAIAGSCCMKVCDCSNPSCPEGYTCTAYDETTCYCNPCSGTCVDNDDCGVDCGCYNGNCSPKPRDCDGPCYTGADCGFGCGCLNGECVDCKTLDCNNTADCLLAYGCTCHEGNCEGSPCANPCAAGDDCFGDCGCLDGQCAPCGNYPCATMADCPEGCLCNGGICGKSVPNPCHAVYCESPNDCGEGCGCKEGMCVPCDSLDCVSNECSETPGCDCVSQNCQPLPPSECDDRLRITKINDECKLKGQLDTKNCCACPTISLDMLLAFVTTTLTVTGKLRKGTLVSDPLLSATGIDNELPTSGSIKFVVRQDEIEVDGGGAPTGITRSTSQSWTANYAGLDTKSHAFTIVEVGDTYIDGGSNWKVIHVCVSVEHVSALVFPNECQYKVANQEVRCDSNGEKIFKLEKITNCKTPLFTWKQGSNAGSLSTIKTVYSTRLDADSYIDYLTCEDGVEICKYYELDVDCGCDLSTLYNCDGSDTTASKLTFCDPADVDITVNDECNSDITIEEVEVCCAMCSADYKVYINGILEGTYSPSEDCVLFSGGLNITKSFAITEVKITFECDTCNDCTITKTLGIIADPCACSGDVMTVSVDASDACTDGIEYTITDGSPNYTVVLKKSATTIYTATKNAAGTYTYNNILPNGSYTLEVTDGYGCKKTVGFIVSTCCQIQVSGLAYDCNTSTISGTINDANSSGTFLLEVGSPVLYSYSEGSGAFSEVQDLTNGSYTVRVTDSIDGGCYWQGTLYVGCDDMNMDITANCNAVDPTVSCVTIANLTGASLPAMRRIYASTGTPVTVDGNGCPTDSSQLVWETTTDPYEFCKDTWDNTTQVVVVVEDAIGRTRCFSPIMLNNCSENSYSVSSRYACNGSQKQICLTVTKTDTYSVTIGPDSPFDYTFTANVEHCFDTSLADGTYSISLTNTMGVTETTNVVVTTCSNFTASYDCDSGLTILRDGSAWTGKIRVDGSPVSYWNYTGPNTVYLADTTPDHVLTVHDTDGSTLSTIIITGIDCCSLSISNITGICDPVTHSGHIEFDIVDAINPIGSHHITITDSLGNTVEDTPSYGGSHYISGAVPSNGTYTVYVYDESYHVPNIGLGSGNDCHTVSTVVVNCQDNCNVENVAAVYKGEINCSDNTQSNTWRVKAINNEVSTLNYKVYRKPNTVIGSCPTPVSPSCSTTGYNLIGMGTVAGGSYACVTTATGGDNTACFIVVFSSLSDPTCKYCVKASLEV